MQKYSSEQLPQPVSEISSRRISNSKKKFNFPTFWTGLFIFFGILLVRNLTSAKKPEGQIILENMNQTLFQLKEQISTHQSDSNTFEKAAFAQGVNIGLSQNAEELKEIQKGIKQIQKEESFQTNYDRQNTRDIIEKTVEKVLHIKEEEIEDKIEERVEKEVEKRVEKEVEDRIKLIKELEDDITIGEALEKEKKLAEKTADEAVETIERVLRSSDKEYSKENKEEAADALENTAKSMIESAKKLLAEARVLRLGNGTTSL